MYNVLQDFDSLPDQTNNSGKYLTTNGETISWATVDALPSQSGNTGKYLYTDGSDSSWEDLPDFLLRSGGTLTGNIYGRPVVGSSSTATGDDLPVLFVSKDNTLNKGGTLDKARYFTLGAATDATGSLTNDHKFGQVQVSITTAGKVSTELIAYRNTANNTTQAKIAISQDKNGNVSTEAPTPATNDNSTKIATTAFVKAQGYITSSGSITGNAATATKLGTSDVGSATQPIYLAEGVPTATTYTLGKSVPSNAIFTDTTYTNGTGLDLTDTTFSLKTASSSVLGGIKVGNNLSIDSNGVLSATYTTYTAGNNITITGTTISADDQLPTQTGNSGKFLTTDGSSVSWGSVFSGDYNDLTNKPTIPTNISAFTNDSGYITGVSWDDVTNKPATFTPATHNHDTEYAPIDIIPAQANNSGKYLTTDGSALSWATVDALPSQTNNSGKFLTTDGTDASWADLSDIVKISSLHYPSANDTTITLTSAQSIPNNVNKYTMSVYRNGIYLNNTIDYGFNSSTRVLTFNKPFGVDEIVTVVFNYFSTDSQTTFDLDIDQFEAGSNITFTDNPVTNKIIISADNQLPALTNNSGKFLTTDGSIVSWATVDALPSQANNSGKFLTTNGTTASWSDVDSLPDQTNNAGKILSTDGTDAEWKDLFSRYTTINISTNSYTASIPSNFLSADEYDSIAVYLDGIRQVKSRDYTVDTSTGVLTFTDELLAGDVVTVGLFSSTSNYEDTSGVLEPLVNLGTGVLTSDGSTAEWKTFTKMVYTHDTTAANESIIIPAANLTNAVVTEVFRDGLLLVNGDDYTINNSTREISFVEGITANEKIVVLTQNAVVYNTQYNAVATTQDVSDNSTNVATTAFVTNKINSLNHVTASDVTTAINNRFANPIEKVNVIASNASITIDPNSGSLFMLALSTNASITIGSIQNGPYTTNGATITMYLNNTSNTISWDSTKITWMSGGAPDVTTNPSIITFVTFNGGSNWYGSAIEVSS